METFKQLENILKLKHEVDLDLNLIEKYQSELNLKTIYENNNDLAKTITKIKNEFTERVNDLKSTNTANDITINKLKVINEEKDQIIFELKTDSLDKDSVIINNEKIISNLKGK